MSLFVFATDTTHTCRWNVLSIVLIYNLNVSNSRNILKNSISSEGWELDVSTLHNMQVNRTLAFYCRFHSFITYFQSYSLYYIIIIWLQQCSHIMTTSTLSMNENLYTGRYTYSILIYYIMWEWHLLFVHHFTWLLYLRVVVERIAFQ